MPEIEDLKLINTETLEKLMNILNIESLEELMDYVNEIQPFNKENFQKKTNLNNQQLQEINLYDEALYDHKATWTDSISQAKEQLQKKQDSAAIIPQYGSVMEICGEDKQETIHSIHKTYKDITGGLTEPKRYQSQEEFLEASENKDLPQNIKEALRKAGFPLTVLILKFDSEQQYQRFIKKIEPLVNEKKLKYLGETPTISPQPNSTPVSEAPVTQQATPSTSLRP